MGSLLEAATGALSAKGLESTPKAADRLSIEAQIDDAAECSATLTLEFHPGNTDTIWQYFRPDGSQSKGFALGPAAWRRTFVVTGAPAGFADRVVEALRLIVNEFADDVAAAR